MKNPSPTITVKGACPLDCPDTCATLTEVEPGSGRALHFRGDPDHPITQGWLCAKMRPYLERVYAEDRILYPLRRVGPKGGGEWQRISWDEAIGEITGRWKAIIAEHDAAAILPYTYSGTLGLVELAVAGSRFWNRLGASEQAGDLCDGAAKEALKATVGGYFAPDPRDVLHSKLVLIWAHNPASTNPHFMPLLRDAQRNGTKVVVIDPRRTITARSADLHLPIKPGTDGALALGMMHVMFNEGLAAEEWLAAHSLGSEELRERTAEFPPERASELTGIPAETIVALAREYATTRPALLKIAHAVNRHQNGGQTVRLLACLPAVAGQMGLRGGGLYFSQSGNAPWDGAAVTHAADCPPPPRAINMVQLGANLNGAVTDPPIMSLFVFSTNPVATVPNSGEIVRGLLREDLFTVVHEQFMTDTAKYADIVLPAVTQLERVDLHRPYGHRHLQYNHQAIAPLGEAVSNWDLMRKLATGMGFTEPWLHQSADEVIAEVLEASQRRSRAFDGITLERLQTEGTVLLASALGADVPFADGRFPTPSGKMEIRSEALAQRGIDPLPGWTPSPEYARPRRRRDGLTVLSGASHHFVTSTGANQPSLLRKEGTPFVEIHPEDAEVRGITHGSTVVAENERGDCLLRAVVTTDVRPGVVVVPKGHWPSRSPGGRTINWLIGDELTEFGGQATYHSTVIWLRPAEEEGGGMREAGSGSARVSQAGVMREPALAGD
jgi:anaerobic selenocysteine-containing dehydrogenase